MPLVRISLNKSSEPRFTERVGECVHQAMVAAIGIPAGDRFQILTEHDSGLVYDPSFLGIERTDGIIVIQITLAAGRDRRAKTSLYAAIVERLSGELGVRPEDVFVSLLETSVENFSFGNGEAQYADAPPAHLLALPHDGVPG